MRCGGCLISGGQGAATRCAQGAIFCFRRCRDAPRANKRRRCRRPHAAGPAANFELLATSTVRTTPFPIATGVPQGCPLSPLLFNLFISSLSSYLDTIPGLTGAGFLGVSIRRLAYADDIAILAESAAALQLALDHIHKWATAWGLSLSVGPSKTQAQFFPSHADTQLAASHSKAVAASAVASSAYRTALSAVIAVRRGGDAAATASANAALSKAIIAATKADAAVAEATAAAPPPLPALSVGGKPVEWTTTYRYLGASIRSDLSDIDTIARSVRATEVALLSTFTKRPVVRRLPIRSQLQLLRGYVVGGGEYLCSTIDLDGSSSSSQLDSLALSAARGILRMPRSSSSALIFALSGLLSAAARKVRAWLRLRLQLQAAPFDSPASRLFYAMAREQRSAQSIAGPDANWAHVSADLITYHRQCGACLLVPDSYDDIARVAAVFARSVAIVATAAALAVPRPLAQPAAAPPAVGPAGSPPPSRGTTAMARFLFNDRTSTAAVAAAGHWHGDNSLAAANAPGLRSVIGMSEMPRPPLALLAALQGAQGLFCYPFAKAPPGAPRRRSDPVRRPRGDAPPADDPSARFRSIECRLRCGGAHAPSPLQDPFHVAIACPHPALQAVHTSVANSIRHVTKGIWTAVLRACRSAGTPFDDQFGAEHAAEREALASFVSGLHELQPDESAFITYRLLLAAPWPAATARGRGFLAAAALGTIFEFGRVGHLRHLCTGWVTWADGQLTAVARAWRAATADLP